MGVYKKTSGTWKEIKPIHKKVNGVWKKIEFGNIKVSGTWKNFFSDVSYLIAFFSSDPGGSWKICNGVDNELDLIGMYLRGSATQGSPTGSNTHEHTSESMTTGTFGCASLSNSWLTTNVWYTDRYHTHDMSHGHASTNHEPLYYEMIPAVGGTVLPANTLLFYDGSTAPTGWTAWSTVYDKFIKCAATGGGSGGNASHEHAFTGTSGGNADKTLYKYEAAYPLCCYQIDHTHTIDHTHSTGNNYPEWHGLLPIRCNDNTDISTIPNGVVTFFKGDEVPDGWTQFSALNNKFIQCKDTNGATGGANNHQHSHSGNTGIFYEAGYPVAGSDALYAITDDHCHTMTTTQHTSVSNLPYYRSLLLCKRN